MAKPRDLTRREFAAAAIATPAALAAACTGADSKGQADSLAASAQEATAWSGYDEAVVIDALASPGPFNVPNRIGQPLTTEMLENARVSGITAVNLTASGSGPDVDSAYADTQRHLSYWRGEVDRHADTLMVASSVQQVLEAKETRRLGLILGFQDTYMFGTDLARFDEFHEAGVKIVQLTYNLRNLVGDGCLAPDNGGLTDFGRTLVERMNEAGALIDLSHCGQRTTAEAIQASSQPISITHSGCSALYDHPRSKRDEELVAMADGGGVLGIYMMPFLNPEGRAQTDHFLDHVEYAVNLCGEDHVGVGSDNSITPTVADEAYLAGLQAFADERQRLGIGAPREYEVLFVEGLNDARRMQLIADGLLARGHSTGRVEKILGANWLRLFGEVWA